MNSQSDPPKCVPYGYLAACSSGCPYSGTLGYPVPPHSPTGKTPRPQALLLAHADMQPGCPSGTQCPFRMPADRMRVRLSVRITAKQLDECHPEGRIPPVCIRLLPASGISLKWCPISPPWADRGGWHGLHRDRRCRAARTPAADDPRQWPVCVLRGSWLGARRAENFRPGYLRC